MCLNPPQGDWGSLLFQFFNLEVVISQLNYTQNSLSHTDPL